MAGYRAAFVVALLLRIISAPAISAHHGSAIYDKKTTLVLTGTVTNLTLANPHSWVAFDVKDDKGNIDHWTVEFGILTELIPQGWTNDTLKPGDQIRVQLHPKRDGDHGGMLVKEITYADGRQLALKPSPSPQPYRAIHWQ
jgi:hypothetical protein